MDERYKELATHIALGVSERIAGLFAFLADGQQADILLKLPNQVPALAADLAVEETRIQEALDDLYRKGVVFTSSRTDPPTYGMCRDLVQFHDSTLVWPEAPNEFIALWREFMEEEWPTLAKLFSETTSKPFTRIIPVGVSIEARTQILDSESVREIVEAAGVLAVTPCTCRRSMRNCGRPLEVCLQVNKAAAYTIKRGSGREVSKAEALEILRKSEEEGLIHVTMNKHQVDNFICNCCPCCCQTMPVLIEHGSQVVDPSRFAAVIDEDACTGCGACHDRCFFGAISWSRNEGPPSQVEGTRCMGCGLCLVTCPEEAISLSEVRAPEFVPGGGRGPSPREDQKAGTVPPRRQRTI